MKTMKYIKFLPLMHHERLEHLGGICKHLFKNRQEKKIPLYNKEISFPSGVNI